MSSKRSNNSSVYRENTGLHSTDEHNEFVQHETKSKTFIGLINILQSQIDDTVDDVTMEKVLFRTFNEWIQRTVYQDQL